MWEISQLDEVETGVCDGGTAHAKALRLESEGLGEQKAHLGVAGPKLNTV